MFLLTTAFAGFISDISLKPQKSSTLILQLTHCAPMFSFSPYFILMQFSVAHHHPHPPKLEVYNGNSEKAFTMVVLAGTVMINNLLFDDS